jgi:hypothetical protein
MEGHAQSVTQLLPRSLSPPAAEHTGKLHDRHRGLASLLGARASQVAITAVSIPMVSLPAKHS